MESLYQTCRGGGILRAECEKLSAYMLDLTATYLALNKGADATFRVADHLDVLDLSMLRQMGREQASKLRLVNVGRETSTGSVRWAGLI